VNVGATESVRDALPAGLTAGGFLLVVSGPSGVGKGTLVERLLQARPECVLSISATTRPRRPHEIDGVQYYFLGREEFERRREAGQYLESAEVHGYLYGTPRAFVDEQRRRGQVVVLEVDVQGGASIRKADPLAVSVFVAPPSVESLRERLIGRGADRPEVVEARLGKAPTELAQMREYDYVVLNDEVERAAARLVAIVDAERVRVSRVRAST
jgi:guanylate kinase